MSHNFKCILTVIINNTKFAAINYKLITVNCLRYFLNLIHALLELVCHWIFFCGGLNVGKLLQLKTDNELKL